MYGQASAVAMLLQLAAGIAVHVVNMHASVVCVGVGVGGWVWVCVFVCVLLQLAAGIAVGTAAFLGFIDGVARAVNSTKITEQPLAPENSLALSK